MTELDPTIVSKSQEKREAEAVSQLAEQLCQLKRKQLDRLPYPNLVDAIMTYQKITKGNARKRQLGFISRQLRRLDLDVIKTLIQKIHHRFFSNCLGEFTHFLLLYTRVYLFGITFKFDQNFFNSLICHQYVRPFHHLRHHYRGRKINKPLK